ncbi:biotin-independent malonate decarboxylase subunit gamma [Oleisolibacter albus]|uniref:biotin-independent malonate decarboxylase subunit gamma n=1 Tax=Oleisolibacter albus TaxID=2171757 RepID=UPI000DF386F1|nr:biotin-independent malonate decarboxylase subunit gamma [Oleisolibacter albus]
MSTTASSDSRGRAWLNALTGGAGVPASGKNSVLYVDAPLGADTARFIAVVPDPDNRFPRARKGEVGLEQGWTLARLVRDTIAADTDGHRRPIVAVVDVTSQAYGKREEMLGIHLACAAAADAYAQARLAGHPVIALLVGKCMSGAFLAHGYQANRLVALDDPGVLVHAMGKQAAARITRRPVSELDEMGDKIPPMSYDIRNYAKLGMLHALISGVTAAAPTPADAGKVAAVLADAVADVRASGRRDLSNRLASPQAQQLRAASIEVRRRLAEQWHAAV